MYKEKENKKIYRKNKKSNKTIEMGGGCMYYLFWKQKIKWMRGNSERSVVWKN